MGYIARALARRNIENPKFSLYDETAWDLLGAEPSVSGVRVNRSTALKLSAIYRGVNLLATAVGKLPLEILDRETREPDRDHFAYHLLKHKANPETLALTFRRTLTAHTILTGNAYAYIIRAGNGNALELIQLLPENTTPVRETVTCPKCSGDQTINGRQCPECNGTGTIRRLLYATQVGAAFGEQGGEIRRLLPENVLHLAGLGHNGIEGFNTLKLARDSVGSALARQDYGGKYYKSAYNPSAIIEVPEKLAADAYKRLQNSWIAAKSGLDQSHKAIILEQGAKANPFAISPADVQLIEARKFDLVEISNWLGMPVHKLGGEGRTAYKSLEEENKAFLDEALDGHLCNWEAETRDKILTENQKQSESHDVEFNRAALLRADITKRYAAYRVALGGRPFMLPDEARQRENMPAIGGTWGEPADPLNMTNPGGINNQPIDPADPPGRADDTADARRQLLEHTVKRMATRICHQARRNTGERYADWLHNLQGANDTVVNEAFDPVQRLLKLDPFQDWFYTELRGDLTEEQPAEVLDQIPTALAARAVLEFKP